MINEKLKSMFEESLDVPESPTPTVAVTAGLCPSCGWCPLYWRTRFQQEWNCANCKPWPARAIVAAMRHVVLHDGEPAWLDEIEPPGAPETSFELSDGRSAVFVR